MTYETRIEMKLNLTEISLSRKQVADKIASDLLNNFTSREIGLIAEAIKQGSGIRLLELIKR